MDLAEVQDAVADGSRGWEGTASKARLLVRERHARGLDGSARTFRRTRGRLRVHPRSPRRQDPIKAG